MRGSDLRDSNCGIAQTLSVVKDWWSWLILREIASGVARFDALQSSLGISRRALTEHLGSFIEDGVLERQTYSEKPRRYDYVLTNKGRALLPILIALQEFGDQWLLGDGSITATAPSNSAQMERVRELVACRVPDLELPSSGGNPISLRNEEWTVLYFFPGAFVPEAQGYPMGWGEIPGAPGCTLESKTYAEAHHHFEKLGVRVCGVSTQRPDQQAAFADWAQLPFPLLSDEDNRLGAALRIPMFRVAGTDRFKRVSLMIDAEGVIRFVQAPVSDPAASVQEMLEKARALV